MRMKSGRWLVLVCMIVLVTAGCKKQTSSEAPGKTGQFATIDWANAGTITGTIHYTKPAPKPVAIDMNQDPACTLGPALFTEQYVVGKDGGLANVFVSIKDGLGNKVYAAPTTP